MAEFQAITTQEELNRIVEGRLERERAKYANYEAYKADSEAYAAIKGKDYEGQIKGLSDDLAKARGDLGTMTKRAETAERSLLRSRVAREAGLPAELADRLAGEDEKAMKADAEALAKLVKPQQEPQPLADHSGPAVDGNEAEMRKLLNGLKG